MASSFSHTTLSQEALSGSAELQADARVVGACVELWGMDLLSPQLRVLRETEDYRFDLCLNRRLPDARLRFADHWASQRFEAPGRLFLLPPDKTLQVRSGIGHQEVVVLRLARDSVREWLDLEPEWDERRLEATFNIGSRQISDLVLQMGRETLRPGFARDVLLQALAVQLAVELERHFRDISAQPASYGLPPWRLRAIEERLRDDAAAPTLTELAALCGLSARQMSRCFKASYGISIGSYVAQHRLENAKRFLHLGEPIKVVAAKTGFASPSSFGYAFRQATGQSPSEFRSRTRSAGAGSPWQDRKRMS